jgi:hypothetical protein
VFVLSVIFFFSYGLWVTTVNVAQTTDGTYCAQRQSCHLARRCLLFRGFDEFGDDDVERFGEDMNVIDKTVGDDELDVIEQCYGVKPVLMSKTSVKPNKSDSGKKK